MPDQYRRLMASKDRQATHYNRGSKDLPELNRGDVVRVGLNHKLSGTMIVPERKSNQELPQGHMKY